MITTDFMGRDGFTWFTGVVEDRADPLKLGRVRVRQLGYHTDYRLHPLASAALAIRHLACLKAAG